MSFSPEVTVHQPADDLKAALVKLVQQNRSLPAEELQNLLRDAIAQKGVGKGSSRSATPKRSEGVLSPSDANAEEPVPQKRPQEQAEVRADEMESMERPTKKKHVPEQSMEEDAQIEMDDEKHKKKKEKKLKKALEEEAYAEEERRREKKEKKEKRKAAAALLEQEAGEEPCEEEFEAPKKEKKKKRPEKEHDGDQEELPKEPYARKDCIPEIKTEVEEEPCPAEKKKKKEKLQHAADAAPEGGQPADKEAEDEACVRSPNQLALHDLKGVLVTPKFEGKVYSQPGHTLQEIKIQNASLKQRQLRLEELSAVQVTPRQRPSALPGAWWFCYLI